MNKPKHYIWITTKQPVWKQYFPKTKKTHLVTMKPCPSCGIHHTPQPVSDKVIEQYSLSQFECDGCDAYRDHLK